MNLLAMQGHFSGTFLDQCVSSATINLIIIVAQKIVKRFLLFVHIVCISKKEEVPSMIKVKSLEKRCVVKKGTVEISRKNLNSLTSELRSYLNFARILLELARNCNKFCKRTLKSSKNEKNSTVQS